MRVKLCTSCGACRSVCLSVLCCEVSNWRPAPGCEKGVGEDAMCEGM